MLAAAALAAVALLATAPAGGQTGETPPPPPPPAPRLIEAPATVPQVILCRLVAVEQETRMDVLYLGAVTPGAVHYYHNDDRVSYDPATGALLAHVHGDKWDCGAQALSLGTLAAMDRAFSTLHPFAGNPSWPAAAAPAQ